jgi:2-dehydro-3-deoxy-D-arabinonate dehydratase
MSLIVRYRAGAADATRLGVLSDGRVRDLGLDLDRLLEMRLADIRSLVEEAVSTTGPSIPADEVTLQAPVQNQEVWAAGVTYLRSRDARLEESGGADVYAQVYASERPELFFKSPGWRVRGPGESIGIRADSAWNVPEPELAVVVNAYQEVIGYTVGNDVSSRDIEGANPLYLPQAKVYDHCCALGPGIRPGWELPEQPVFQLELCVRRVGTAITEGAIATTAMARTIEELVGWLGAALTFPVGAVLLTGTGIIPDSAISLSEGDDVIITASEIGTLGNHVQLVGETAEGRAGLPR